MPPIRTMPNVRVPQKTERTHEENQERAYIAASRRSDRSLEARMESARRASDIHKKRTGRALRVTEKDVVNEEMYEEEDEDLEAQMRRLTAHINTSSPDFNRRLQALLSTQISMRMAVSNGMYSNGAGFAPNAYAQNLFNMQGTMQNNMLNMQNAQNMQNMQNMQSMQNMQNMQQFQNTQTISPQMMGPPIRHQQQQPSQPQNYRHSPYQPPHMRPKAHHRTASVSSPSPSQQSQSPVNQSGPNSLDERRASLPVRPSLSRSSPSVHSIKLESPRPTQLGLQQTASHTPSPTIQANPSTSATPVSFENQQQTSISPLTTTLPAESQVMMGSALDPNDPSHNMLLAGNMFPNQPFFNYTNNYLGQSTKSSSIDSMFAGMDQTLSTGMAPHLDTAGWSSEPQSAANPTSVTDEDPTFSPNNDTFFDSNFFTSTDLSRNNSNQGSTGQGYNAEEFNDLFDWNTGSYSQ